MPALAQACDTLYTRIIRPDQVQIASQYFRLCWLPLLGAARAWLILHLRARCYLNTQDLEVRDICSVAGLSELSSALGVSISTVKTCLAEPLTDTFLTRLATHRPAPGRVEMNFRVEMIDPFTPADRQRLAGEPPGGQQPDSAGSLPDQEPDFASSPPDQEPESAPAIDQRPDFAASLPDQKPDPATTGSPSNGQNLQDTKTLLITSETMTTHQHQLQIAAGQESLSLAAAAGSVSGMLTHLNIQEPAHSRILTLNPPAAAVLAWAVEAFSSDRIENKPGFLASMLLSAYRPPAGLTQLVNLPVADWLILAAAARDTRTTGHAQLPLRLAPHFETLYPRLGHLDPARWPILLPLPPEAPVEEEDQGAFPTASGGQTFSPTSAAKIEPSTLNLEPSTPAWAAVLADLRTQMDPSTFNAWLKDSHPVRVEGNHWVVAVRNQTAADWLEHRLLPVIQRALQRIAGRQIEIEFEAEG